MFEKPFLPPAEPPKPILPEGAKETELKEYDPRQVYLMALTLLKKGASESPTTEFLEQFANDQKLQLLVAKEMALVEEKDYDDEAKNMAEGLELAAITGSTGGIDRKKALTLGIDPVFTERVRKAVAELKKDGKYSAFLEIRKKYRAALKKSK